MALSKIKRGSLSTGIDDNSDATAITIDSSERIGIGTTSPSHLLDATVSSDSATARFGTTDNTGANNGTVIISNGGSGDGMLRFDYEGSNTDRARLGVTSSGQSLEFFTNGDNERMRIQANGCVTVGYADETNTQQFASHTSATNVAAVDARSTSTSYTNQVLLVGSNTNTTNSTYNHIRCDIHGVAQKMAVRDSGNVVNANDSYGSLSDQRMKENIVDAESQWDDIKAVQVRKFNMIGDSTTFIGVVAQELEASGMGGLIDEGEWYDAVANPNNETRKSVKTSVLHMKALKALQEAIAKIETLETEMTALKARVTALEDA